ncbi:MAG: trigger factor, partial [Chloroflexi bacterium]|nr:trigger factor [Chloroflexota bacterium]
MKFEKKELKDHQVELVAEVTAERFESAKQKAARRISKNTKIPGFRPGKAPYDIIKRNFGDEAIEETAIDLLVNEIYPEVIKEAGIKPYGPGKLEDIESKDPPKFRFTIPLEPEVKLGDYSKVKQAYKLPPVIEDDVKKVVHNLQLNYATAEPIERAAEKGDLVSVKITTVLTKPDKDQEADILKGTPHQMVIGEETEEEQFPFSGFGDQLIGLKAGDTKDFKHKYSKDSIYEKLRGKEADFSVTVESVKKLIKPELDDEFAKSLGIPTYMDLESSVKEQLETGKRNEYDNKYYDDLLEKIVKVSEIKYPPLMLEDEIQDVLKNIEEDIARQNLDLDTYLKLNKREKEEFINKDVKPAAQKRLEHALVLDQIGRQEKIELDQTELQKEFSRSFMQMQSAPNFKDLQKEFTTKILSNMVVMQAATRLMNRRTLEKLKEIVAGEGKKEKAKDDTENHLE